MSKLSREYGTELVEKKSCLKRLRTLVEPDHPCRQCELLGFSRSTLYYQPATESEENLHLMRQIDEQYRNAFLWEPPNDSVSQASWLPCECKRISRLTKRLMGIEAIYPKPKLSQSTVSIGFNLLRDYEVTDQVWSADITYIPMNKGFMYLVVILNVITWELSNSLGGQRLASSIMWCNPYHFQYRPRHPVYSRFHRYHRSRWHMSMDGAGRAIDNIYIERFWRSVKYEDVYLKLYPTGQALFDGLANYMRFYNEQRFTRVSIMPHRLRSI